MLSAEEYFSVIYLVVSSLCLLHQLRSQTFVSVECGDVVWVFCLEDKEHQSNFRYVLNEKDMDNRCNNQGASGFLWFFVFLLTSFELVLFLVVIYAHHFKVKRQGLLVTDRLSFLLTNALLTITGILIGLLVVFPLIQYYTFFKADSAQDSFFHKILDSPPRALISFIITLVTAPLRSIFHDQFTIELNLGKVYPNFSCVEPVKDSVTSAYKCSMELSWPANIAKTSPCKTIFSCAEECRVVFPRIIISSLSLIFASFTLCYRLLKLRHNFPHRDRTFGEQDEVKVRSTTVANQDWIDNSTAKPARRLNASNRCEMKDKSLDITKPAASDLERRTSLKYSNVDGYQIEPKGTKIQGLKRNGQDEVSNGYIQRHGEELKQLRSKNGNRRTERSHNRLIKKESRETCARKENLEELGSYSSSEDLGDAVLVEDESEYYMSGFRL